MAGLRSCSEDRMASKASNIYSLALDRRSVPAASAERGMNTLYGTMANPDEVLKESGKWDWLLGVGLRRPRRIGTVCAFGWV